MLFYEYVYVYSKFDLNFSFKNNFVKIVGIRLLKILENLKKIQYDLQNVCSKIAFK